MDYKDFVKLCFYNIRNSIKVTNMRDILPIRTQNIQITYIDENKISINSSKYKDVIFSENGYFRCDEIIKSIAKIYGIEYIDNTLRSLLILHKELFNVIDNRG